MDDPETYDLSVHVDDPELCIHGSITWSERWRSTLLKLWQGAQAVVIQYCANPEKRTGLKKIQRIRLKTSKRSPTPIDDVDDVIEAIASSIYGWLKSQVEEGRFDETEVKHFAVEVQRVTPRKETPSRNKMMVSASLAGEDEDQYDGFEAEALSELERQRQMYIENLQRQCDHLVVHTENLHETIIKLATINTAPMKEAADMMGMSNQLAMSGMQATLNAAMMRFDVESKRAAEDAKTERLNTWIKSVGKHVFPFIPSAVASLIDRVRGGDGNVAPPDLNTAGAAGVDLDAKWRTNFAALKSTVTPEQWAALEDVLASSQYPHVRALLDSQTFGEAMQHYSKLIDSFDVEGSGSAPLNEVMEALKEIFDDKQTRIFIMFHMEVCEVMEAAAAEEYESPATAGV